jgi:hypothetical protein
MAYTELGSDLIDAAREWDRAFADWMRFDSYGPQYRSIRDARAERMEALFSIVRKAMAKS